MAASELLQKTIYTAPLVHTPTFGSLAITPLAHIGVDEDGVIRFIEPASTCSSSTTACEDTLTQLALTQTPSTFEKDLSTLRTKHPSFTTARNIDLSTPSTLSFLSPGFIDTHTHAPQYPNIGIFGNSTLLSWLERYTFPTESSLSNLSRAERIYNRVVARSLAAGTTASAYYATKHVEATNLLADICLAKGQRALVGRVCMDRLSPADYRDASPEDAARDSRACAAHCAAIDPDGRLVRPVITPRFAPSCSMPALKALGALQHELGCWAQTHISENTAEIAMVKAQFPDQQDYASVYEEAGLLNERCILAHAVHLTEREVDMVAKRQAKIAHCPVSNTCLTSGALRVKEMIRRGIDVGLGTDMSGGYSFSILEMARQAMSVSRHVAMHEKTEHAVEEAKLTPAEAFYLATLGGARSMGLEDKVGTFEVGKEFDAQLIRLDVVSEDGNLPPLTGPVDTFGWETWEDIIAKWMHTGDDRNVAQVWVRGRRVHGLTDLQPGTT